MGKYVASVNHLTISLNSQSKDLHRLKHTDLNAADKMNFAAVLAICDERTETLLADVVPASHGTRAYLWMMRYRLQSYICEKCVASTRIYYVWYGLFFLRLWRKWIHEDESCRAENVITYNAYVFAELNAQALVNGVVKMWLKS